MKRNPLQQRQQSASRPNARIPVPASVPASTELVDFFLERYPDETYRYVVFDAANIMHKSSYTMTNSPENAYIKAKAIKEQKTRELEWNTRGGGHMPDVYGLLSLMRFFVAKNFEVLAFIPYKYTLEFATNYPYAVKSLIESGMAQVCETNHYDDSLCIETALRTGGVILSNDLFRDHKAAEPRLNKFLQGPICVGVDFEKLNPTQSCRETTNGHLLKCAKFSFWAMGKEKKRSNDPELLHARFFAREYDERQELCIEVRESWTQKQRDHWLNTLDELLLSNQQEHDNILKAQDNKFTGDITGSSSNKPYFQSYKQQIKQGAVEPNGKVFDDDDEDEEDEEKEEWW